MNRQSTPRRSVKPLPGAQLDLLDEVRRSGKDGLMWLPDKEGWFTREGKRVRRPSVEAAVREGLLVKTRLAEGVEFFSATLSPGGASALKSQRDNLCSMHREEASQKAAEKPLFIVVKREFWEMFRNGTKPNMEEYRPYGAGWNERVCRPGRLTIIAAGYRGPRLHAVVEAFRTSPEPTLTPAWEACGYKVKHPGKLAACIKLKDIQHTFTFDIQRTSGGRKVTVVAPNRRMATDSLKLEKGEDIVRIWDADEIVFDPFRGIF